MDELTGMADTLAAKRDRLKQEMTTAKAALDEKTRELRKIDRLLAILSPETNPNGHVTKNEVVEYLKAIRAARPGASLDDLRKELAERLVANGRSTLGLGLVFGRALSLLDDQSGTSSPSTTMSASRASDEVS